MSDTVADRDFLLRSLDDLESERAAGNIDDATYRRLHSDYTARAAATLRAAHDGVGVAPEAPRPSSTRRVAAVVGIVGFAVLAAFVLASALGGRLPGRAGSGSSQVVSEGEKQRTLERAAAARPTDVQAQLALARFLTARKAYGEAFKHFSRAAQLDRANAEAQAYTGWLAYLAGLGDAALPRLDAAIAANEAYPDAHFFKGVVLFRGKGDAAAAVPEFQRYLTLVPDGPLADQVRVLLAAAVSAS